MSNTTNVLLNTPAHGSFTDNWDQPVNDDFIAIDGYLGGVQGIAVSSTPITLTSPAGTATPGGGPTQAQNSVLKFSGTLTANVQITLPLPGNYIVHSNFSPGAGFVLTLKASGSGQIVGVAPGSVQRYYCDGTNVFFVGLQPVGSYLDLALSQAPGWMSACTVPPFLTCDGSTFSAATYPILALVLNGTTLPDFRGRSAFYLNGAATTRLTTAGAGIDGNTAFAAGGVNGITLTSPNQLPAHTHNNTLTDPGHLHSGALNLSAAYNSPGGSTSVAGNSTTNTGISATGITITNASVGAGANIPNAAPGIVSGVRLIRAG